MALITLLTDFGLADTYVGQMKGAILSIAPNAPIVDVTHNTPPQDVRSGAYLLWSAVETFPADSIHLAVVDPGVGSPRRGLAIRAKRGDTFIGPDNGLLIPAVERLGGISLTVELTAREFWRPQPSASFHGRDVFGPVAAHVVNGVPLDRLGPPVSPSDLSRAATWPPPDGLNGQVIHVDTYGNLITNFPSENLPRAFAVVIGDRRVPRADYYAAVAPGELLALVGSAGLLEISAREANAAHLTGAVRGTPVRVTED